MKKLIFLIMLLVPVVAFGGSIFSNKAQYEFGSLRGGINSLDSVDGNDLVGNEVAFIFMSGEMSTYVLNASSGAAEDYPDIIAPDVNPGNKRWILYGSTGTAIHSAPCYATSWGTGLSDEVIWQTQLQAGETLMPNRLEIIKKSGSPESGLNVDVYDATTSTELWSTYSFATGTPLESGSASKVQLRITNSTGSNQEAIINFDFTIR